jgi:hypothetical protein
MAKSKVNPHANTLHSVSHLNVSNSKVTLTTKALAKKAVVSHNSSAISKSKPKLAPIIKPKTMAPKLSVAKPAHPKLPQTYSSTPHPIAKKTVSHKEVAAIQESGQPRLSAQ